MIFAFNTSGEMTTFPDSGRARMEGLCRSENEHVGPVPVKHSTLLFGKKERVGSCCVARPDL